MKSETLRERRRKATVLCNFIASAKERCVAPTATHAVLACLTYSSTTLSHNPNKKIAERERKRDLREREKERAKVHQYSESNPSSAKPTNKQTTVTNLCKRPNSDSERQEEEEE
jgi:hypothetical protein